MRRQKQLQELLAAAPMVEVVGVVSPVGVSGGRSGGEELWMLRLVLDAWRIAGGQMQTRPLRIQRKLTDPELKQLQKAVPPDAVVRLRARVVLESPFGEPAGLLDCFVGREQSDTELNRYALQLQQPVHHQDPVFGTLTLDRRVSSFSGAAAWRGRAVALHLSAKTPADLDAALRTAHSLWQAQDQWHERILDFAVQQLLPLKNESWLGEDEAEITAAQFKQRMALKAISAHPDGSFDFWHSDGDLFWGHLIEVAGNLREGPKRADIPG